MNLSADPSSVLPFAPPVDEPASILPFRDQVEEFERRVIRDSLERHGGRWASVARELGLHRSNLHHLAGRLGLRPTSDSE